MLKEKIFQDLHGSKLFPKEKYTHSRLDLSFYYVNKDLLCPGPCTRRMGAHILKFSLEIFCSPKKLRQPVSPWRSCKIPCEGVSEKSFHVKLLDKEKYFVAKPTTLLLGGGDFINKTEILRHIALLDKIVPQNFQVLLKLYVWWGTCSFFQVGRGTCSLR